ADRIGWKLIEILLHIQVASVASVIRKPHANTLSEVLFEREIPLVNPGILVVKIETLLKVIDAGLSQIRGEWIGKRERCLSVGDCVRKDRHVAGVNTPRSAIKRTKRTLNEAAITARTTVFPFENGRHANPKRGAKSVSVEKRRLSGMPACAAVRTGVGAIAAANRGFSILNASWFEITAAPRTATPLMIAV